MKKIALTLIALCGLQIGAGAAVLIESRWETFNGQASLAIPDLNPTGVFDTRSIVSDLSQIVSLSIYLEVEADYVGDLYAYVQHNSGFTVLLNRPGRTAQNPFGYDDTRIQVTFRTGAPGGDIHNYRNLAGVLGHFPLTGFWEPDGRNVDPALVLDTSPRTATMGTLISEDPNGEWTLFVADMSAGGESILHAWGVSMVVVPEPGPTMACMAGLLGVFGVVRRLRMKCRGSGQ